MLMSTDPSAPLEGAPPKRPVAKPTASDKPAWVVILPVPENAPAPPAAHPRLGKPSRIWCYRDAAGAVLGYVMRFEAVDGKQFRPLTYAKPAAGGAPPWRLGRLPPPQPPLRVGQIP